MTSRFVGPFLVGLAAFLWATDSVFRFPVVSSLDPTFIVLSEHVIVVLLMLPPMLLVKRKELLLPGAIDWLALAFIGIGGSAIATVLFTAAFIFINPSVVILLQKIQPVVVVTLAMVFLGERPKRSFWAWAMLALAAAVVLSFPDLNFTFISQGINVRSRGFYYALGAAGIWAAATVAGRHVAVRHSAGVVTFWRFVFGLGALIALMFLQGVSVPWNVVWQGPTLKALAYMALIPGLVAMVIYYAGLRRTPASTATFMELLFPLGAVALNTFFLGMPLDRVQLVAGVVLLFAVTMITMQGGRK